MSEGQRIDKWLWAARIVKTRTLASKSVSGGIVRVNGIRVTKPGKAIQIGDVITFVLRGDMRIFQVNNFSPKRGPYEQAKRLYEDLTPAKMSRTEANAKKILTPALREKGSGRPTKKQRRDLTAWTTTDI